MTTFKFVLDPPGTGADHGQGSHDTLITFLIKKEGFNRIVEEWKHLSAMLGSRIKVALQNGAFEGQAHNIDDDGSLIVRLDSGILRKVSSGDIIMVR